MNLREDLMKSVDDFRTLTEAFYLFPGNNARAVFGNIADWLPPYGEYSENRLIDIVDPEIRKKTLAVLLDATFPFYDGDMPDGLFSFTLHEKPDHFFSQNGHVAPGEAWFFINGIATNKALAMTNGNYLAELTGRKIHIVHNPSDSFPIDLYQCVRGKVFEKPGGAAECLRSLLSLTLKDKKIKKTVLVAHSQGTIIAANVLRELKDDIPETLEKLEIYTLANCADDMLALEKNGLGYGEMTPYMEHFSNTNDLVARLGVQALKATDRGEIKIDGRIFTRDRWGHFMNAYYLEGIKEQKYRNPEVTSRFYDYLKGKSPDPLGRRLAPLLA